MVILELVPDLVLVYRDTNSTLASAPSLKDERANNMYYTGIRTIYHHSLNDNLWDWLVSKLNQN